MSKEKYREPSNSTLKNDRSNHLENAQDHLRSGSYRQKRPA